MNIIEGKTINLSKRYLKYCQIHSGNSSTDFAVECVKCPWNQIDFERMVTATLAEGLSLVIYSMALQSQKSLS